ncbi:hypothetical protein [Desulfosporosinus sp. FKB]|nr:hypothetical protein [Desulfosporosinus sp. FKB]
MERVAQPAWFLSKPGFLFGEEMIVKELRLILIPGFVGRKGQDTG